MATGRVIDVTATPSRATGPSSRLAKVKRGILRQPQRYVFHGPEGVGKTTLAADAPSPIFIDAEDGSASLNVARYQFRDDAAGGHVPITYQEVLGAIEDLTASPHDYKTLVIDTADRIESMLWRFMLERDSELSASNPKAMARSSIEDYGYGKGYQMAVEEWRALCARLDRLRSLRGMSIIILAHTQIRTFKNPEGEDFDRYQLRINDKAAGFLREWSDVTGFACFEDAAAKLPGKERDRSARVKGFSTGRRMLRLRRTAAYDAKARGSLPEEIELTADSPWAPIAAAVEMAHQKLEDLARNIALEVERIGDAALKAKVDAAVAKAVEQQNESDLARYLVTLRERPSASEQKQQ